MIVRDLLTRATGHLGSQKVDIACYLEPSHRLLTAICLTPQEFLLIERVPANAQPLAISKLLSFALASSKLLSSRKQPLQGRRLDTLYNETFTERSGGR